MLVGSMAALAHGRSRSTQDFDVVIDADLPTLRALVRSLPDDRFYASLRRRPPPRRSNTKLSST